MLQELFTHLEEKHIVFVMSIIILLLNILGLWCSLSNLFYVDEKTVFCFCSNKTGLTDADLVDYVLWTAIDNWTVEIGLLSLCMYWSVYYWTECSGHWTVSDDDLWSCSFCLLFFLCDWWMKMMHSLFLLFRGSNYYYMHTHTNTHTNTDMHTYN